MTDNFKEKSSIKYKVSIGIVAYQNYDEIIDAISTMMKYTPEIITKRVYIIDNSCETKLKQIEFKRKLANFQDVEYIDVKENIGFGKGHNYILNTIESEYHCIMNPDILFCEDVFTSIIHYLDTNPDVGMVIPKIVDEEGKMQLAYREEVTVFDMFIRMFCKNIFPKRVAKHTLQDRDYSKPFCVPFGQGSFLVIRTELFKKLKGFDDNFFMYLEDADLCKRVNQESKLMYIPYAKVIHKWHQDSHKNMKLFKIHLVSMKYYFKKWGCKLF